MKFTVDDFGVFPFFVVFVKIKPDDELVRFRGELLRKIKSYCYIKNINRPYKPHTTIALGMGLINFFRIWFYIKSKPRLVFTNHIMRVTLLKEKKILYEYDFLLRKLLNRRQALNRGILAQSFGRLKQHKKQ